MGSGLLPPNRFDIFPTKEKTELFSGVRFIPAIADVCLSSLTDMIPSRRRSYETVSIYASFLSPGGPICVMKPFLRASMKAISTKLNGIYSVADLLHMVKSIKQRMAVNSHPHKQLMKILISIEDI